MKRRLVALLLALVATPWVVIILLAQQQRITTLTYLMFPTATWSLTTFPATSVPLSFSYTYTVQVQAYPSSRFVASLSPLYTVQVQVFPARVVSNHIEPSYTLVVGLRILLRHWKGGHILLEFPNQNIYVDRFFWDGGVRVCAGLRNTTVFVNATVKALGATVTPARGGVTVTLAAGSCALLYEEADVVFYVIDPLGMIVPGVQPVVNGTPLEQGVVHRLPLHTTVVLALTSGNLGRVLVSKDGGPKLAAGQLLYLANVSTMHVYLTQRGEMHVILDSVTAEWGSGDNAIIRVRGRVLDSKHMVGVGNALVTIRVSGGGVIARAYTGSDGTFYAVGLYMTRNRRLPLSLNVQHDDYEPVSIEAAATLPARGLLPTVSGTLSTLALAALSIAAIVSAAAAVKALKGVRREQRVRRR